MPIMGTESAVSLVHPILTLNIKKLNILILRKTL
jgi:hypothetical protein